MRSAGTPVAGRDDDEVDPGSDAVTLRAAICQRSMTDAGATIRGVLDAHGRLPMAAASLKDGDDLYQRGLSSHASVNVMLALENAFDVEFPDSLLRRDTFRSVESIRDALESLGVAVATV